MAAATATAVYTFVLIISLVFALTAPVIFPITNVTLTDGLALNRGVALYVGSRGTPLGLRLTTIPNNTRVRNYRDCLNASSSQNLTFYSSCQGASGSLYDPTESDTFRAVDPEQFRIQRNPNETVLPGYDTVKFTDPKLQDIKDFPLEVWSNLNTASKSGLAVGKNSSFLSLLKERGLVPSNVWGLFFGSRSQTSPEDGELVVGGFNPSRVNLRGHSWANFSTEAGYIPNHPCPLQVLVSRLTLRSKNGTESSLLPDPDAQVPFCLDPWQNVFSFTPAMASRFAALTRWERTIPGEPEFMKYAYPKSRSNDFGELVVTLAGGHTTVIPHHELVSEERGSDAQGKYAVINDSRIMASISGADDETPVLGGVFLRSNYLLVEYARKRFSLAPAVLGKDAGTGVGLITVLDPEDKEEKSGNAKIPAGSIAAIVLGTVAAVALFLGAGWWWMRRRRRKRIFEQGRASSKEHIPMDAQDIENPGKRPAVETIVVPDLLGSLTNREELEAVSPSAELENREGNVGEEIAGERVSVEPR